MSSNLLFLLGTLRGVGEQDSIRNAARYGNVEGDLTLLLRW
jgi:hypothetical protein